MLHDEGLCCPEHAEAFHDLLAALESAPEPAEPEYETAGDRQYRDWYDGPRAAALAKVKA